MLTAYFDVVYTDDMLVVRVGRQPRDYCLRAGHSAGSDTSWAHISCVSTDHHSASCVPRRTARRCHRANADTVRLWKNNH